MKNILFLHSSSELYGSDRSLLNLIKNLDKSKFNITVILPVEGPLVGKLREIKNVDIIIKEIAVLRRKNLKINGLFYYLIEFIKSISFINDLIRERKIDVVYTNTAVVFPGAISARICGKKSVWHIREIVSNNFERKLISLIVNRFSNIIIANSKATANAISNNKKKVKVVYNAIEGLKNNQEKLSNEQDNTIYVGMAGRINRWKGQKLFVDMAERVLGKFGNVKFLIAGSAYQGEEYLEQDLAEYIGNKNLNNNIELLGQVTNMNSFYNNIDIFVLPSIQPEPFGLVILEAMDRCLPVVATNHGGPTEIIDNGVDGFLVNHTDSIEMSNVILDLLKDKKQRDKIGNNGKQKRDTIFTISNYVNQISGILENV